MTFEDFPTKKNLLFKSFIQTGLENAQSNYSTASLVSRTFRQSGINCTLQFYYHFSSQSSTSRISVKVHTENGRSREIWDKTNVNLRFWIEEKIRIGSFARPFHISINCESGHSSPRQSYNTVFACGLAAIDFQQCQDLGNPLESCSAADNTICDTGDNVNCLHDVECDMKRDCPNGIDEQSCDHLPVGAQCDFNNMSMFCDGWHQVTRIAHEKGGGTPKPTTIAPINKLLDEPVYLLRIRQPGPRSSVQREARSGSAAFLMYDAGEAARMRLSPRKSALVSPVFPRTNPDAYNSSSPQFGTCKLRFYACTKTFITTWRIVIISKSTFVFDSGKRDLFVAQLPEFSTFKQPCEWTRHLVAIPRQNRQFRLAIIVDHSFDSRDYFAIDDLSLSPTCFEADSNSSDWHIPNILIHSCGATGATHPSAEQCSKFRDLDGQTDHFLKERGSQEWTVPHEGFYRIEMCGAAGGKSRNRSGHAGECAEFQVHFVENLAVRMIVGQMGEPGSSGGGGGGATLLTVRSGEWDAIVGGGGGASDGLDESVFTSGYGASLVRIGRFDERCGQICQAVSQSSFSNDRLIPHSCPQSQHSPVLGGFGGGGSSCGARGGSGAGYEAGHPAESGSSHVDSNFSTQVRFFKSEHVANGYIRIGLCRRKCESPSICRFRGDRLEEEYCSCPDGNEFISNCECPIECPFASTCAYRNFTLQAFCQCKNGKVINDILTDECEEVSNSWILSLLLSLMAFATVLIALLFVRHYKVRNEKMEKELIEFNNLKSNDFMYDETYFGTQTRQEAIEKLPIISRSSLKAGHLLGKGNFGEVLKGVYYIGESEYNVAVKVISRQYSTSIAAQSNFCNEALCMGTFVHENIVKLIGINFEEIPFMIVAELMEGGDLLAFMKSCRPTSYSINPNNLSMLDLVRICYNVACGCKCLDDFGYVHRDIAARNILLTKKGPGRIAKIADFGLAKEITYGSEYYRMHGRTMLPIKWTPPEAFIDGVFTTKSDVWSFGVFCWEVFSLGVTPYPNKKNEEVMLMITEGERMDHPYGIPIPVYQLMRNCWKTACDSRLSFAEIVEEFEAISACPSIASREFPIHPSLKFKMHHLPFTPTSCETPKTPTTATTVLSNESEQFGERRLIRTLSAKEEDEEKKILFKMRLEKEPPYVTDLSRRLVEDLRRDLFNMKEEDAILNIMQPDLSSFERSVNESTKLIGNGNSATTPPAIDIHKLAVQDTGPALHRPDSLNIVSYVSF